MRRRNKDPFLKSPYLWGAIIFHLLIGMWLANKILFEGYLPKTDFVTASFIPGGGELRQQPPPTEPQNIESPEVNIKVNVPQGSGVGTSDKGNETKDVISVIDPFQNDSGKKFGVEKPVAPIDGASASDVVKSIQNTMTLAKDGKNKNQLQKSREFALKFSPLGGGNGPVGSGNQMQASLDLYALSTVTLSADDLIYDMSTRWWKSPEGSERKTLRLERGPLKNLAIMINAWSQGKIKAHPFTSVVQLTDTDIYKLKIPFIYFSGKENFSLSPKEIENLRNYLLLGGCIWGDNRGAENNLKFEEAFKREMKRVIPDPDKNWEQVPNDSPIFMGPKAFFQISGGSPPGANAKTLPIEMIQLDQEISILYTPNNYTDMMRMTFKQPIENFKNTIAIEPPDLQTPTHPKALAPAFISRCTPVTYTDYKYISKHRNFTAENGEAVFKLAINIVTYVLTRYQDRSNFGS